LVFLLVVGDGVFPVVQAPTGFGWGEGVLVFGVEL
jgi:hypothetical protein